MKNTGGRLKMELKRPLVPNARNRSRAMEEAKNTLSTATSARALGIDHLLRSTSGWVRIKKMEKVIREEAA